MNTGRLFILFRSRILAPSLLWVASTGLTFGQDENLPQPITIALTLSPTTMDHQHLKANRMGYMPTSFRLVDEKPACISKIPAKMKQPKYGAFRIGNGPRSITYFVIDEPQKKPGRFVVDLNQNGDLTDDGPGGWDKTKGVDGNNNYSTVLSVPASWGTPLQETEGGSYSLFIYKRHGDAGGAYAKMSGREGKLVIGDKAYDVTLAEYSNDGMFTVCARGDLTRRHVQFGIDLDGDGTFRGIPKSAGSKELKSPEQFDLSEPFQIDDQWYIGRPTISGDKLTLTPIDPPGGKVVSVPAAVGLKPLLAAGAAAPEFTVNSPEGKPVSLGDFQGKVTIIDFWSTSCGPCLTAMPGLERVYQATKAQGVAVLSMNVFDTKERFEDWLSLNETKYSFTFAFDPAENGSEESVASAKFHVPLLPTIYVVSRDGKVVAAMSGSGQEENLIKALKSQGVKINED